MQSQPSIIESLKKFKQRDKFSSDAWRERGLNILSDTDAKKLSTQLDDCTERLISSLLENKSNRELKKILRNSLKSIKKNELDTEEKEFVCDLYFELASITKVDLKDDLNSWLYGSILSSLLKIKNILRPERIQETLTQPCTRCDTILESYIMKKESGIPSYSWYIVKCTNCNELNLIDPGQDIKEFRFGNYEFVEQLAKDEFNKEQAQTRLQQIAFFRK